PTRFWFGGRSWSDRQPPHRVSRNPLNRGIIPPGVYWRRVRRGAGCLGAACGGEPTTSWLASPPPVSFTRGHPGQARGGLIGAGLKQVVDGLVVGDRGGSPGSRHGERPGSVCHLQGAFGGEPGGEVGSKIARERISCG